MSNRIVTAAGGADAIIAARAAVEAEAARLAVGGSIVLRTPSGNLFGYTTLTQAKTAATSGSTIFVYSGVYNESDLLKDGVNYWFEQGSGVTLDNVATGNVFSDASGAVKCSILGNGTFKTLGTGAKNLFDISQSDTEIYFSALQVDILNGNVFNTSNGVLNIQVGYANVTTGNVVKVGALPATRIAGYGVFGNITRVNIVTGDMVESLESNQEITVKLRGLSVAIASGRALDVTSGEFWLYDYRIDTPTPLRYSGASIVRGFNLVSPAGTSTVSNNNGTFISSQFDGDGADALTASSAVNVQYFGGIVVSQKSANVTLIDLDAGAFVKKEFTVAIQAEVTPSGVSNAVDVINDTGIVATLSYFGGTVYRLTFASSFVGASDLVYPASFIINEDDGRVQNLIVSRVNATTLNINASDNTGLAQAGAMFIIKIQKP